jgi:UDP-N-acetylmuramoylalanine--D-glutamate ligase
MIKAKERELGRRVRVGLIGLGSTNRALLSLLSEIGGIEITVRDIRGRMDGIPDTVAVKPSLEPLDEDILFPSPSVRRENLHPPASATFLTDYDLLFANMPRHLFTVSGSDGKSTTVDMTSRLLAPRFPDLFTGGNLGTPLWRASLGSRAFLLELSSFTLRYSTPRAGRALLTNVTPNHLDWHASLEEYNETKLSMIRSADEAILNLSDEVSRKEAERIRAFCLVSLDVPCGEIIRKYKTEHTVTVESGAILIDGEPTVCIEDVKHRERHNLANLASAIALTIGYAERDDVREVAVSYEMLGERCEAVELGGVYYVSSSIDTTPARTRATLEGLDRRVRLILGGRGKGLSLEPLREVIAKYADRISVYGEISEELTAFIESDAELARIPHSAFKKLGDAIDHACDGVSAGETVLLSPAATSYGEFSDYKERGRCFKARVASRSSEYHRENNQRKI